MSVAARRVVSEWGHVEMDEAGETLSELFNNVTADQLDTFLLGLYTRTRDELFEALMKFAPFQTWLDENGWVEQEPNEGPIE